MIEAIQLWIVANPGLTLGFYVCLSLVIALAIKSAWSSQGTSNQDDLPFLVIAAFWPIGAVFGIFCVAGMAIQYVNELFERTAITIGNSLRKDD